MAEQVLAGNTHTSVVLRAIGVQDGRPYDKKYAFPNRFTLVRCLNNDAWCRFTGCCSMSLPARRVLLSQNARALTATRCEFAASHSQLTSKLVAYAATNHRVHLLDCSRIYLDCHANAHQPAADAGRPAPQQSR